MTHVTRTDTEDGIAVVTLTRPERRNALNSRTLDELHTVFDGIAADPAARVVVLTGEGVGFCAGADMKASPDDMVGLTTPLGALLERVQGPVTRTFASQELMA